MVELPVQLLLGGMAAFLVGTMIDGLTGRPWEEDDPRRWR